MTPTAREWRWWNEQMDVSKWIDCYHVGAFLFYNRLYYPPLPNETIMHVRSEMHGRERSPLF